jgi:hypothetical protein
VTVGRERDVVQADGCVWVVDEALDDELEGGGDVDGNGGLLPTGALHKQSLTINTQNRGDVSICLLALFIMTSIKLSSMTRFSNTRWQVQWVSMQSQDTIKHSPSQHI